VVEDNFAHIDPAGKRQQIFHSITDHIIVSNNKVQPMSLETTTGRDLLVEWVDGTKSWIALKNPGTIEAAEYSVARKLT
jgi:hypothetical protein